MTVSSNKTIAKNTLLLYVRQVLMLLIGLYTVRVVLDVLGVVDYGIYSVVAGIVTFFSFLSATMASATQRFFSFALGQEDLLRLKQVFSINLLIYIFIAFLAFTLLETIGLWFVENKLEVPPQRFEAAKLLFHVSIISFVATIFSAPFIAIVIAHEDMTAYAYISIFEVILKLIVVILLTYIGGDKLVLYGVLLLLISFLMTLIYLSKCLYAYEECQFRKIYWNRVLMHEIVGFTGWTLFGQITTVARNQALTILLNQFFNPVVVASRAIAVNITGKINVFSSNFNVSLYPPIIKAYAGDKKEEMFELIFNGSKITFFLMWVFSLPLFLEMEIILKLWLKNPPEYAVLFTRLALVEVLIVSLSLPITTAARAPGRMKEYELILGFIQLGILAISWLGLERGWSAASVFVIAIFANIIMFFIRLFLLRYLISISVELFFKKVFYPILFVMILSGLPSYVIHISLDKHWINSTLVVVLSMILSVTTMYYWGIDKIMRKKLNTILKSKLKING